MPWAPASAANESVPNESQACAPAEVASHRKAFRGCCRQAVDLSTRIGSCRRSHNGPGPCFWGTLMRHFFFSGCRRSFSSTVCSLTVGVVKTTSEGCLITSAGLAQRAPAAHQCAPPAAVFVAPVAIGADFDLSFTGPTNEHPVVFGNLHFFSCRDGGRQPHPGAYCQ